MNPNSVLASDGLENTVQTGFEYDDNIFKTFDSDPLEADLLLKLLFKTQKSLDVETHRLQFGLQFGGKKYFFNPEQDTGIGQFDVDWQWPISENVTLNFNNVLKGQIENASTDPLGLDINENFISETGRFTFEFPLYKALRQQLLAKSTLFNFYGDLPIDYVEWRFGSTFILPIDEQWRWRAGYELALTDFTAPNSGNRDDKTQEISAGLSYYGPVLISLGYAYTDNNSSQDSFSSSGHRVQTLISMVVGDITLHLLGSLQIRSYPAVFISDDEGQRLLFSESEDSNFNTLTVKLTKELSQAITGELKYSRYSNEFSDREADFARDLYMLGIRATF